MCEDVGDGGEIVSAQPLGKDNDDYERKRGEDTVDDVADATVVSVANVCDEDAAAHSGSELCADYNIKRQLAVSNLPVSLSSFLFARDDVGGDKRHSDNNSRRYQNKNSGG